MTVPRKVLTVLITSLACMVGLVAIAVVALDRVAGVKDRVIERESQLVVDTYRIDAAVSERAVGVRNFLLTHDDSHLDRIEDADQAYATAMGRLRSRTDDEESDRLLATLDQRAARLVEDTDDVIAQLQDGTLPPEGTAEVLEGRLIPARQAVTEVVADLIALEERLIREAVASSNTEVRNTVLLLLVLGATTTVAALAVGVKVTRGLTRDLTGLALSLDAAGAEILAGTAQQVAGASQQAAAVQQTVATADELAQTADQSAQWARTVADRAQLAAEVAQGGTRAVQDSVLAMNEIRAQVESIAATVVSLAERAQDISGIVQSVDELAEQVHLLGLNAAIEAARAGEHGRGFAVVATEVRALADQSRRATVRISEILGEVQQRTNAAVIATEQGGKSATLGVERIEGTGSTIDELAETVASAAVAAEQISASSGQQAIATSQISQAMRDLDDVTQQSASAARQVEQTARDLNAVAAELKALVGSR